MAQVLIAEATHLGVACDCSLEQQQQCMQLDTRAFGLHCAHERTQAVQHVHMYGHHACRFTDSASAVLDPKTGFKSTNSPYTTNSSVEISDDI